MDTAQQQAIFDDLASVRAELLDLIDGADLGRWVNETTGRRVVDVLAHLAQWETYASMSLEAYANGDAFRLPPPFDIHAINQRMFEEHRARHEQDIVAFLVESRDRFVTAAKAIPLDRWPGPMRYPWGAEGGVAELLVDMKGHEATHQAQIRAALGSTPGA